MKIVYVKEEHISCTGENDDHPKVYYTLKNGEAICGYCNIKYVLEKDEENILPITLDTFSHKT